LSDKLQCILISDLIQPLINCDYCRTGPVDCSATPSTTTQTTTSTTSTTPTTTTHTPPCKIVLPSEYPFFGEVTTHHKFEASDGTVDIMIQGQTGCQLRALVVGGGGKSNLGDCGGGSGYLNYTVQPLENPSYKISVAAGGASQSSMISINGITIRASPGLDAQYRKGLDGPYGGNGYSGGGGACYDHEICPGNFNGGTNGSNGGGPSTPVVINDETLAGHGNGTGEDISGYHMDKFKLSPGQGGTEMRYMHYGDLYVLGGGGGGILVDGEGPKTNGFQGHGYGAGGAGGGVLLSGMNGLSGVVLIEING